MGDHLSCFFVSVTFWFVSVSGSAYSCENDSVLFCFFIKQGDQIQNLKTELERVNEECQYLRLSEAELTESLEESRGQVRWLRWLEALGPILGHEKYQQWADSYRDSSRPKMLTRPTRCFIADQELIGSGISPLHPLLTWTDQTGSLKELARLWGLRGS